MKLTAGTTAKSLATLITEAYSGERLHAVNGGRGQGTNVIISNTHIDSEEPEKILYVEKFGINATVVDSEPIYFGESRSFSNNKINRYSIVSDDASHEFYLT